MVYSVGLIGTGPKQRAVTRGGGFAIGRVHADNWRETDGARLTAACDIREENLNAFLADYGLAEGYADYREMLRESKPDIVDICTWPGLHFEMAMAAVEAGAKGIYLEKPMVLSLGEGRQLVEACAANSVKLIVSHQRRFEPDFRAARTWMNEGRIGRVLEIQGVICGEDADLLSWGTHWFDMFSFLLNDEPVESVMAQTDCTKGKINYGHRVEDSAVVEVEYANGVRCYLRGDFTFNQRPFIRIIGDKGMLELGQGLRGLYEGNSGWTRYESGVDKPFKSAYVDAMQDLVDCIREDRTPVLDGRVALRTTEVIMAAYESSYRRGRVRLPLAEQGFPLLKREEYNQEASNR